MRVLVSDPVADNGIEYLRQHADVDVRTGLSPRGTDADHSGVRRPGCPERDQGDRRGDRGGQPASGHRPSGGWYRQHRRGRRHPAGHSGGERSHWQQHRGGGVDDRHDARSGAEHTPGQRICEGREVAAIQVDGRRVAREAAWCGRHGQDRHGGRAPSPGAGDAGHRLRPLPVRRACRRSWASR